MKNPDENMDSEDAHFEKMAFILNQILQRLNDNAQKDVQYYDNADLKRLLHVSDSTLHRMRKSKDIPYRKIRGKIYYPKSFLNNVFKI